QLVVALLAAKGQAARQVAVEAGELAGDGGQSRLARASREIRERKEEIGPFIHAPATRATGRAPEEIALIAVGVTERIERLEGERLTGGSDAGDSIDREGLGR